MSLGPTSGCGGDRVWPGSTSRRGQRAECPSQRDTSRRDIFLAYKAVFVPGDDARMRRQDLGRTMRKQWLFSGIREMRRTSMVIIVSPAGFFLGFCFVCAVAFGLGVDVGTRARRTCER
jgi:hypothetical protein